MSRGRWVIVGGVGLMLFGAAVGEHLYRRIIERRYHEAVESRRQLERRYGDMLASHEQLKTDLAKERERSKELSSALSEAQTKMEEVVARLTEETRTARELQARLAAMQQHMNQLQGELAMTLQERQATGKGSEAGQVQLERIVVSDATTIPTQGRVISIHSDWNFVVIDLGWDAVKIGETVSIFHDQQLLAKARIERIQEGVCAATILPEWEIGNVHVNDVARLL